MITEAEHAELLAAKTERDEYARAMHEVPLGELAHTIVREATRRGMILTITQRSVPPLAMGNTVTDIEIRAARGAS